MKAVAMTKIIMCTRIRHACASLQAYLVSSELHGHRNIAGDSSSCYSPLLHAAFAMATEQLAGVATLSLQSMCRGLQQQAQPQEALERYRAAAQSRGHQSRPARRGT